MNGKIGFLLVSIKQQCFSSNLNDVSVFSAKTKGYVTFVISCARPSCSIFVLFSSFLFCSFHSLILLFFPSIVLSFPTSFLSFFLFFSHSTFLRFHYIVFLFMERWVQFIRIIYIHPQANIIYYPRIMFK